MNSITFLFSAALVGVSVAFVTLVSRPGLAEDQPALVWWLAGDIGLSVYRFVPLLQPGILLPGRLGMAGLRPLDFAALSSLFLMLGIACHTRALAQFCGRAPGSLSTAALLGLPALLVVAALQRSTTPADAWIVVSITAMTLTLLQIVLTVPSFAQSRGLAIMTIGNGAILIVLLSALAYMGTSLHVIPAALKDAPAAFVPPLHGIVSNFINSVVSTFAFSMALQERQRAFITQLSTTDMLTGALNRRGALPVIRQALAAAQRRHEPLSVAMIDIDHFKRVNDTLGHEAGDAVLRDFAGCMLATKRDGDVLARWGGEEFLLVFPGAEQDDAVRALQRLRTQVLACRPGQVPWQVRFSAGLTSLAAGTAMTIDQLVLRADQCLYRAKLARDCIVADRPDDAPAPAEAMQAQVPVPG